MPAESLMHYRECLLFLDINRKRLCQTLSSVDNSIIVLLFGCIVLLGLTEKSTNYRRGLYVLCHDDYTLSYDELLSKQDLVNIHI